MCSPRVVAQRCGGSGVICDRVRSRWGSTRSPSHTAPGVADPAADRRQRRRRVIGLAASLPIGRRSSGLTIAVVRVRRGAESAPEAAVAPACGVADCDIRRHRRWLAGAVAGAAEAGCAGDRRRGPRRAADRRHRGETIAASASAESRRRAAASMRRAPAAPRAPTSDALAQVTPARLGAHHLAHGAIDRRVESRSSSGRLTHRRIPGAASFCFSTRRASETRHFTVPTGMPSIWPISS